MEEKQEEKREIGPFEPPARMSVTLTLPELAKKLGMPDGMTVVSVEHHSFTEGSCELYATDDGNDDINTITVTWEDQRDDEMRTELARDIAAVLKRHGIARLSMAAGFIDADGSHAGILVRVPESDDAGDEEE